MSFISWLKNLFTKPKDATEITQIFVPAGAKIPTPKEPGVIVAVPPVESPKPIDPTPWMTWLVARIGWTEFDHDKELSQYWKYTNVPGYKTVIGATYAWCALTVNAALNECGFKGTKNAAADSFKTYGTPCEPKYGAIIVIRHITGHFHVTTFYNWADEPKKLMRCLGGNQGNALRKSIYDLSGNANDADEMVACVWPVKA